MRSKLILLIVAGGLTAAALLVVRQERLQAVFEMTRALDRAAANDQRLWKLRVEIARQITPERVRRMAEELGDLQPIPLEICDPAPSVGEPLRSVTPGASTVEQRSAAGDPPSRLNDSLRRGAR